METFTFCINLIGFFLVNTLLIIFIIFAVKNCPFLILILVFIPPLTCELIRRIKLKRTTLNNTNVNRNHIFIVPIGQSTNNFQLNQFQHSNGVNLNSQLNQNSINQSTESPPYDMVTIELPSYEEAVKQKNTT